MPTPNRVERRGHRPSPLRFAIANDPERRDHLPLLLCVRSPASSTALMHPHHYASTAIDMALPLSPPYILALNFCQRS
jgi:hypothetical protein